MRNYSEGEKKLFGHFGYYGLEKASTRRFFDFWKECVLKCFADIDNFHPEAVKALRRGYIYLFYKDQAGGTPEYEKVIEWDEN